MASASGVKSVGVKEKSISGEKRLKAKKKEKASYHGAAAWRIASLAAAASK
jgi:hypothetical protein